jgi:hypothetical protein
MGAYDIYGMRTYSARSAVGLRGRRVMIKLRVVVPLGPTTRRRLRAQPFRVDTWNPPIPPRAPLQPLLHSLWCAGLRKEEQGHPQPGRPGPARPRQSTRCHWRPGCYVVRDISLVRNLRLNPSGTPTAMVGRASRRKTGTTTAWSAGRRAAPTGVPTAWPAGLLRGARSAIC